MAPILDSVSSPLFSIAVLNSFRTDSNCRENENATDNNAPIYAQVKGSDSHIDRFHKMHVHKKKING